MTLPIKTHYRACHLCEAICGLKIQTQGDAIVSIKGDDNDPFSRGHICPKGVALQDLHTDPDRLSRPVIKKDGHWVEVDWGQALDLVAEKLADIQTRHGQDSVGVYAGNPTVHNYGLMTHGVYFSRLLKTKNIFSAASVDQLPQHLVSYLMYGHQHLIPVPDIDRCDLLVIIGANPIVSNGSLMTAPDVRTRLKAIQARSGKIIVIDPRATETAKLADQHMFIRPGTDAALLLALINELLRHFPPKQNPLAKRLKNLAAVKNRVESFSAENVAKFVGVDVDTIKGLAADLMRYQRVSVYGRMGISTHAFGSLCHWAVQVLNIITASLDTVGGVMLSQPAINPAGPQDRQRGHFGRWRSRVRGLAEFSGELPCSVMAEEILSEGEGQIKAMLTIAGNPVLSTPAGRTLDKALASLEFMVCVDPYINETTQHADVILPPASPLVHEHYDLAFHRLAIRNTTRFNQAVFDKPDDQRYDWEIFQALVERYSQQRNIPLKPAKSPSQLIEIWMASGPYAQHDIGGEMLSFASLLRHPHGIDLGPLHPSLEQRLCTEDGMIDCLPDLIAAEIPRLEINVKETVGDDALLLIGRRDIRTNNSWMHNSHRLVKGKSRCVLFVHPEDLEKRGINDGSEVVLSSGEGSVSIVVEASEDLMPGVVSLPHGWGHDREGVKLRVAQAHAGVSMNDLSSPYQLDGLSGNAVLNAIPVRIEH